jgi:hypothetical protein
MTEPAGPPSRPAGSWWRQNRGWALPAGCLALVLPALSIASCLGAVLTFLFAAIKLGISFRRE